MSEYRDQPHVTTCINLCEAVARERDPRQLEALLASTCVEAGFPGCERLYVGSYFCENFFLGISDDLHECIRALCAKHDMGATLVVPILGQAFFERASARLEDVLARFGDVYDEVVVNDIAQFHTMSQLTDARIGLGRMFQKEQRDARYTDLMKRRAEPFLSSEALECIELASGGRPQTQDADADDGAPAQGRPHALSAEQATEQTQSHDSVRPLVEVDPVSETVDVSRIAADAPGAEIAIHLPYCFATTGRNCGPASITEEPPQKFRLGRQCSMHCLRMAQGCLTDEGVDYLKHGRAYYFANPACRIAGVNEWRIVYAATHETMRA